MHGVDEFWEELLAQIEAGQVIPVVGPELLVTAAGDEDGPLYRVLARRLLAKYGLAAVVANEQEEPGVGHYESGDEDLESNVSAPTKTADIVVLRHYHELNDAVCALVQRGRRVQDLYRPVNDILGALVEQPAAATLATLRQLASISKFKLFVTTTPDDLLARVLDTERYSGMGRTEQLVFAPKLASGTVNDLPDVLPPAYTAVCYLFGKASPTPFVFAIHDEDTLEFVHNLQVDAGEGIKRLFSELRKQNLLLIGCDMPDWLSRFFIRLSNTQRLADNRSKHEFLVEQSEPGAHSLTLFLERFSPDTWVLPGGADQFVAELARRWQERHPPTDRDGNEVTGAGITGLSRPVRRVDEAFFVSYSSQDLGAARKLFATLRELGADVAWFDKSELKPGDDWKRKIRSAVNGCYLFLPLISANTESREEGFFRDEWSLASERAHRIQGRKFIIPVVIDPGYDGNADRYRLVPEEFALVQFAHAPDGEPSREFADELIRLLRERRLPRPQ